MGKEVERWDPPNKEQPKYPIPLWGACSIKVKGNEAVGPIFPVKRENDFAANALKADVLTPEASAPPPPKTLQYPVFQDTKHTFTGVGTPQSPCDVGGMPKLVAGPTYGFTDGKNGFVPAPPVAKGVQPQINGPVFQGVETGSGKFCPMMPPKVDAELLMSGPVFPIPDHYSKYTPQPFGCSGSGLKLDLPKELNGPGNRDVGDRHSALIDSGKYVPEVKPKVEGPLQMSGPKLPNIEAKNQFNIVTPRVPTAAARMEMPGPVYPDVVSSNHYSHVEEKVPGQLIQQGPVFRGVEAKSQFQEIPEKQPGQLIISGPVFRGVDDQVKFTPAIKKAETESLLVRDGPKRRGIDDSSKYNERPMKSPLDGDRLMTAPIFPGIEAQNKYGPVEPELAPKEKIVMGPPFVAPNYPGIESKNVYNLDKLENGLPAPFINDDHIMVGPKYPGIEEGHEYHPQTQRKPVVSEVQAPVYIEEGSNSYSVCPEKVHGDLLQPLPCHRGVTAQNVCNNIPEKQPGQLVLAGPVFRGVDDQCKYTPDMKKAETESLLVRDGPKRRGIDDSSKYNERPMKSPLDGDRLMTGPIFPGIKAENSFGPASMGY
jgi:hypothetical protein